uniref:(northern house mosquito) hypothetical protein n=1 Tax=Culex pipiens TaxID=7175 RepID=A0A8D8A9C4_CULPI
MASGNSRMFGKFRIRYYFKTNLLYFFDENMLAPFLQSDLLPNRLMLKTLLEALIERTHLDFYAELRQNSAEIRTTYRSAEIYSESRQNGSHSTEFSAKN